MKDYRKGLCFIRYGYGPKLGYRMRGGFGYRWLPDFIQHAIVRVWNSVMCQLFGHDWLDYRQLSGENLIVCVNCCKEEIPWLT
jgi:hypothetical protein